MIGSKNIYFSTNAVITFVITVALLFTSCKTAKYIPEGKYILNKNEVKIAKSGIDINELEVLVKQKPNKRIFGLRFHMGLYNLSNPKSDNRFSRWFRKIGEEPVIFDPLLKEKTNRQLLLFLKNKGYYNAVVTDSTSVLKHEVKVQYFVNHGTPYIIQNISYVFSDTAICSAVLSDTATSLLHANSLFDVDILQNERLRIENNLKNKAFFTFSNSDILYEADTSVGNQKVNLKLIFRKIQVPIDESKVEYILHKQYKVRNVNVVYKLPADSFYILSYDSTIINDIKFIFPKRFAVNPSIIAHNIYIAPRQMYSLQSVDDTYRGLTALKVFKYSNIQFIEVRDSALNYDFNWVDCKILLSSQSFQSYQFDIEGTTSSGPGAAGKFIYQHKNFFGSAELFKLRLKAATEALKKKDENTYTNTLDIGAEVSLLVPKFMLPIKNELFIKKYNPRTQLSSSYNYLQRPEYAHTVANFTYGYIWKGNKLSSYQFNMFDINVVKLLNATEAFQRQIDTTFLKYSLNTHLVAITGFTYIFNNQNTKRNENSYYLRFTVESAGNSLRLLSKMANFPKSSVGAYELFNIKFAQFVRSEIDVHYYMPLNQTDKLAYRFLFGAALPYTNSKAVPFEKQFFSGGANSIRAWAARDLGPGSFVDTAKSYFPYKTSDIKLEVNIEYRFKLFWKLEGAMFVDAGNIWAINKFDTRKGALFAFNSFYNEIAIGSGMGLRLDLSFFIVRVDMGVKVRNPAYQNSKRWIFNQNVTWNEHFNPVIGINYPF